MPKKTVGPKQAPASLKVVPKREPSIHGLPIPPKTFKIAPIKGQVRYGQVAKLKPQKVTRGKKT